MPTQRQYRLRIRNPADTLDLLVAHSRLGDAESPDHPFLEDGVPFRHDGASVDPLNGRVTSASATVPLIDWYGTIPIGRGVEWAMYWEDVRPALRPPFGACVIGAETKECAAPNGDEVGWLLNTDDDRLWVPPPFTDWTQGIAYPHPVPVYAILDGNCWGMSIGEGNGAFYAEGLLEGLTPGVTYTWEMETSSPLQGSGSSNNIFAGIWAAAGDTRGVDGRFNSGNSLKATGKGFLTTGELLAATVVTQSITFQSDSAGRATLKVGVYSVEVGDVCRRLAYANSRITPTLEEFYRIWTGVLHEPATARGQLLGQRTIFEYWDEGAS